MNKVLILALFVALAIAVPQNLNDLTGTYSLWRPPQWPNYETCCYLQGANITVVGNVLSLKSLVMGPCAQYLPGANGQAYLYLESSFSNIANGTLRVNVSYFTSSLQATQYREYLVGYSVELTPAPVDILTFTSVSDANCTFELRNDTVKAVTEVSSFFKKFLSKMEKLSSKLEMFLSQSQDDYTGKFSLWRPPTWQNYSNCCYLQGANVTYDSTAKEFTYQAFVMGPCAAFLPGTYGTMKAKVISGSFEENNLKLQSTFYTTSGQKIKDLTFTVTADVELTPAPVNIYIYHNTLDGTDTSCDFKFRKDTY